MTRLMSSSSRWRARSNDAETVKSATQHYHSNNRAHQSCMLIDDLLEALAHEHIHLQVEKVSDSDVVARRARTCVSSVNDASPLVHENELPRMDILGALRRRLPAAPIQ